jgi:hypothetical protein
MINKGVVEEAVRIKMRTEGADPDFLSQPNAPAPPIDENNDSENRNNSDSDSD